MGMGGGGGSQVVYYVPTTQGGGSSGGSGGSGADAQATQAAEAQKVVTPAVAKSINGDSARAIQSQTKGKDRRTGLSATFLDRDRQGVMSGRTLGGN